jgi:tRNA dimethylallyltransferase
MAASPSPVITIVGPTASGKTELALRLAKRYDGWLIGADSRQIYKELEIGSAKPPGHWAEQDGEHLYLVQNIPHYMVDIIEPDQPFTVADFVTLAERAITDTRLHHKLPIVVGGTGLYIDALIFHMQLPRVPPNPALRNELTLLSEGELRKRLREKDPKSEARIKDKRRLIRALEVITSTGKPFVWQPRYPNPPDGLILGVELPRNLLYDRIDARIEEMFQSGLVEETRRLTAAYDVSLPSMSSLGYAEIAECLEANVPLEEAKKHLKVASRRLAKRQLTWTRRNPYIKWVPDFESAITEVDKYLASAVPSKE